MQSINLEIQFFQSDDVDELQIKNLYIAASNKLEVNKL